MNTRQESRKRLQNRINRILGQVQGISRMVEEDRYCVDILTQIAAVRSALDSVGRELLTDHIESCVVGHGTESEHHCAKKMTQEELIDEVRTSLERFLK
jgi:CsoR family transcriptional regulator, copper-sensing transcriptional repressor